MLEPVSALLQHPRVYLWVQRVLGAERLRRLCLDRFVRPQPHDRILDLGCGPARILEFLGAVDYVGFDTESRCIAYARRRYAHRGSFYCEEFSERHAGTLKPFDAILLFGLLHHLDDARAGELLRVASHCLKKGGRMVTLDPCITPGQSAIARWVAMNDRGRFVRTAEGYDALVRPHFSEVTAVVVHNVCRIPSTERIMRLGAPTHAAAPSEECGSAGK